jgi:cytochrome c oxidase cbb3-type subunit I/II
MDEQSAAPEQTTAQPGSESRLRTDPDPTPQDAAAAHLETFVYDDAIVRKFTLATLVWALVATLAGVVIALQLVLPTVVDRLGPAFDWLRILYEVEWLSFGRLRPLHTNAAIFAFAGNAVFAAIYYSTQRLCKAGCSATC